MSSPILIRPAQAHEADLLTQIAITSKAHWGYSEAFMASCKEELTIHSHQILAQTQHVSVATLQSSLVGFYSVSYHDNDVDYELDALFVDPKYIGKGIGSKLLQDATQYIRKRNGQTLFVQSDPFATHFYLKHGAKKRGQRASGSIPDRFLPLLAFELA